MTRVVGLPAQLAVPAGWFWHPLGSVMRRSRKDGRPDFEPLSVFLDAGVVPRTERADNHNQLGADLSNYLVVEPSDLVFNKLRTWQGGFGASCHRGIVSPAYYVLNPMDGVDSRFLDYLLHSAPYLAELKRLSKWMPPSQFDMPWEDLKRLPVPLPPLEVQRRIADFLDDQVARIDRAIQLRQRQMGLLQEWEDSEHFRLVSGMDVEGNRLERGLPWLGPLPAHWGVATVGSQFEAVLGKMLNEERGAGENQMPYLRNTNVQWNRVDLDDLKTMSFSPDEVARYGVRNGDLLVCEGGQPGRAAIYDGSVEPLFFQRPSTELGHDETR